MYKRGIQIGQDASHNTTHKKKKENEIATFVLIIWKTSVNTEQYILYYTYYV